MSHSSATYVNTISKSGCGCSAGFPCPPGQDSGMERARFFPRQLVTPDDLTQDQLYFRDKSLRHNRLLHGWGVVCGARVMPHPTNKCKVIVESGYILGPYGHEILIEQNVEVDLCHEGIDGNAVSGCGSADPWCSNVRVGRPGGRPLYLAVRYDECEARPVRAEGHGCGCNEADCEYSRIRDSFAIKLLLDLPSSYTDPMPQPDIQLAVSCGLDRTRKVQARACPPCPPVPWVILADVTLHDDGTVADIDCFAHRRYVASFADFYFLCRPQAAGVYDRRDILTDLRAERENLPPARILVGVTRVDGTTGYLPVHYEIQPGETFASFLEREGGRQFGDPATGETFTLRDVYSIAGVQPTTTLNTLADATMILEGATLRLSDLQDVHTRLEGLLDAGGTRRLEEEHLGSPAAVTELTATNLRGVGADSPLGRKLAGLRVGEVAALDRTEFVNRMLEGVPANQQERMHRQAEEAWDNAAAATRLTETWRPPPTG